MKELDDELRNVLRREDPPAGFAERVMGRVGRPQAEQRWALSHPSIVRWAAAAAIVATLGGGLQYRAIQKERDERARGEAAAAQVMDALRLAGSKLQKVQASVKEIGS
jgi:hypothetical protein